jgi:SAM-dependent methyltransferase
VQAATWDDRFRAGPQLCTLTANQLVVQVLGDHHAGRALDVAAGEGRNAVWLAERGWRVTAVDFSQVAVDHGRDLAVQRGVTVEWVLADVTAWRPPAQAFDAVVVSYLQLAAEPLAGVLARAAGALASGGTLVAVGHHVDNLEHGHGGPPHRELLWEPAQVAEALSGLEVSRAERVERCVDVDDAVVALDALVVAGRG